MLGSSKQGGQGGVSPLAMHYPTLFQVSSHLKLFLLAGIMPYTVPFHTGTVWCSLEYPHMRYKEDTENQTSTPCSEQ